MAKAYADLADLPEDKRINAIANAVLKGERVAFFTDDIPGKPERYIAKLRKLVPNIVVEGPVRGPVKGVVTVSVELPAQQH